MAEFRDELERIGPEPGRDPAERLVHSLRVYGDAPDNQEVLTATRNVYGRGAWTGLTLGDLRGLAERLEGQALTELPGADASSASSAGANPKETAS